MVTLSVIRYSMLTFPFAILAMVIHRVPLIFNRKISFYKLLGSGRNGSFSAVPSLRQWAVLAVHKQEPLLSKNFLGNFIHGWWKLLGCEVCHFKMNVDASHGLWDGKEPFQAGIQHFSSVSAVITRASIRRSRANAFWKYVAPVAADLKEQPGLIFATGIGEAPWLRQGTFSIWNSLEDMKAFAYKRQNHMEVIRKTHKDDWYSEDLYARFGIIECVGTVRGNNPLNVNT